MTALEQALRTALFHFVWQGAVVAFLLWITLLVMRKRSANARYAASCLALIALVAWPVITACAEYNQSAVPSAGASFFESVPQAPAAAWTGSTGCRTASTS